MYALSKRRSLSALLAAMVVAMLVGCEDNRTGVSYSAYNHTDRSIVSVIINGEGGVLNARAKGGGGEVCCVVIPNKWRPGLTATIKWEEDGDWLLDESGREVIRDGKRVYVPRPYKQATVFIPEYDARLGRFNIHFLPNDEVKVIVNLYGPRHPDYPIRFSSNERPASAAESSK